MVTKSAVKTGGGAVEERVTRDRAFEVGAGKFLRFALRLPSGFGGEGGDAVGGQDEGAGVAVLGERLHDVGVLRADRDGEVGG